jgi:hypothetical protein
MEAASTSEAAVKQRHKRHQSIDDYCAFLLEREDKTTKEIAHLATSSNTTIKSPSRNTATPTN